MKRILINATQNEEIRVALCKGNHLYDFDLENRTREQKKSNIYKGHVTRVEPSLEAVFVEYGSQRQGFLPIREISSEYLSGNPRDENIKKLIKEGDELIVQVEKEERGNKGAALSTYVSLAGRYLVLMPNNPRGGGISRQISGKLREDMKRMLGSLDLAKGMSVIIRTAGIGKTQEDLQHDLNHLLNIWQAIQEQNQKYPSPRLVHQEAGVVTRAVRDYLRDDISEIWIDNENAYIEAAGFIDAVMPTQAEKLRKYTDYEPMFSRFNVEKQIETAYQREVRLPSGGSIVIDQTEALVSIDINSAKSTKGSDVAETAYHTNLEAADEIARQLRLRDMGGLIVIDFIDMNDNKHQKEVEKRLIDATKYDRARVQFGDISKFGLMEMSRQRLRPSLEESTGYICPRCHGNGMIRDLRSLSLSIMRQIEQIALKERQGEVQAEVPTDIAAFLLNEKRDSLVYLEQDSGTRITILPHAHLESPNFKLHFNRDGFAPSSYERITDTAQEHSDLGYDVDWQTADSARPEQQPTRQPLKPADNKNGRPNAQDNNPQNNKNSQNTSTVSHSNEHRNSHSNSNKNSNSNEPVQTQTSAVANNANTQSTPAIAAQSSPSAAQPQAVAWLSNLFAQAPQAQMTNSVSSRDAAEAIEMLVNTGAKSLGSFGQVDNSALSTSSSSTNAQQNDNHDNEQPSDNNRQQSARNNDGDTDESSDDKRRRKQRKSRSSKPRQRRESRDDNDSVDNSNADSDNASTSSDEQNKRDNSQRSDSQRTERQRNDNKRQNERQPNQQDNTDNRESSNRSEAKDDNTSSNEQTRAKRKPNSQRGSRGTLERNEALTTATTTQQNNQQVATDNRNGQSATRRNQNPNEVVLQVNEAPVKLKSPEVVHLSLDDSKSAKANNKVVEQQKPSSTAEDTVEKDAVKTAVSNETKEDSSQADNSQSDNAQSTNQSAIMDDKAIEQAQVAAVNEQKVAESNDAKANSEKSSAEETVDSKAESKSLDTEVSADTVTDSQKVVEETSTSLATIEASESQQIDTVTPTETKAVETVVNTDAVKKPDAKEPAIELTHRALFAKRYVTASKFGQASNDPRVVRAQQASQTKSQVTESDTVSEQAVASVSAIRGTVGDFIKTTLAQAQTRLNNEGVINCFIAAIAEHKQQAQAKPAATEVTDSAKSNDNNNDSSFDFSNYGYQPLSADYLSSFESMTTAVGQFAVAQGKTSVEPRAITQRASNDPRGQHPSFEPQQEAQNSSESEVSDVSVDDTIDSVDSSVSIEATLPIEADAHEVAATALTSAAQAEDVSAESEQLLQADADLKTPDDDIANVELLSTTANALEAESLLIESELLIKEDSQGNKSKTTIASYKNMIENVAEQLLPQSGMFNLTTPKVPKARARKPKTEHKKPTQVEKAETDDSDSES